MGSLTQGHIFGGEGVLGTGQNRGNAFIAPADPPDIVYLSWYRAAVGSNRTPVALRLYDQVTGTSVSPPAILDSGTVGWQDCPLSAPQPLVGGRDYIIAAGFNSGQTVALLSQVDPGPPDDGFTWESPEARYTNNGPNSYPDQALNDQWVGVDVVWDDPPTNGPAPDGPTGNPDEPPLIADLAWWLHKDTTNPDAVGQVLKAGQTALQAGVDEAVGMLEALIALGIASRFGTVEDMIDAIGLVIAEIPIGNATEHTTTRSTILGSGGVDLTELSSQIASQSPLGRSPVDTTSVGDPTFTETANRGGSGAFAWNQPADTYVLTITNPQDLREGKDIEGVPYFKHRGSWSSLDNGIVGDYHSIVGTSHLLREVGARLQGVVVYLEPHINWTIQAFDYTG